MSSRRAASASEQRQPFAKSGGAPVLSLLELSAVCSETLPIGRNALWREDSGVPAATVHERDSSCSLEDTPEPTPAQHRYLNSEDAVRLLGSTIGHIYRPRIAQRYRPISCSKDWRPPQRDPPAWSRLGKARTLKPDEILRCLESHGLIGTIKRVASEWSVYWITPDSWTPDHESALQSDLLRWAK